MRTTLRLFAALSLLAVAATPAHAQMSAQRSGWYFSGGLGYGSLKISCDGCEGGSSEGGLSGYLALGKSVNDKVVLGLETTGWTKTIDETTLTFGALTGTAAVFPLAGKGLFLKGGVGLSVASTSAEVVAVRVGAGPSYAAARAATVTETSTGLGALARIGYDLPLGAKLAVTPSVSYMYGKYADGHGGVFQAAVGITLP